MFQGLFASFANLYFLKFEESAGGKDLSWRCYIVLFDLKVTIQVVFNLKVTILVLLDLKVTIEVLLNLKVTIEV